SMCIHDFEYVQRANGTKEFCILRRWMINTKGVKPEEAVKRVLISDLLPHDTTIFASFEAKLLDPRTCAQSPVPTTTSENERMEYLKNWVIGNSGKEHPFWGVQVMDSIMGKRASMSYYARTRLEDGTLLTNSAQGEASCGYQDNAYSSHTSTTMVVPGRDSHLVYALSASCFNPAHGEAAVKEIDQIKTFKGTIHKMYCEDEDGKFKILKKALGDSAQTTAPVQNNWGGSGFGRDN
ncbi:MAG: hypothetical protein KDD43_16050, partial [Bdellovibrionales bacterium]|nr:hypothetical protein [Bdellovibrionales bacterium]